jgi:hypothetical protein
VHSDGPGAVHSGPCHLLPRHCYNLCWPRLAPPYANYTSALYTLIAVGYILLLLFLWITLCHGVVRLTGAKAHYDVDMRTCLPHHAH